MNCQNFFFPFEDLFSEAIQEKYGSNLQKEMQGPYHDIVSRLFRAITEQRITVPGSFTR